MDLSNPYLLMFDKMAKLSVTGHVDRHDKQGVNLFLNLEAYFQYVLLFYVYDNFYNQHDMHFENYVFKSKQFSL